MEMVPPLAPGAVVLDTDMLPVVTVDEPVLRAPGLSVPLVLPSACAVKLPTGSVFEIVAFVALALPFMVMAPRVIVDGAITVRLPARPVPLPEVVMEPLK